MSLILPPPRKSLARVDILAGIIRVYPFEIDPTLPIQKERHHYHKTYAFSANERGEVSIQGAVVGPSASEVSDISKELFIATQYEFSRWNHEGKEHIFTPRESWKR